MSTTEAVKPRYPEDVQKALTYMDDAGWTRERMQGLLAIALSHLEQGQSESMPEVVVMLAEGDIDWTEMVGETHRVDHTIEDGDIYLVCPECCGTGTFEFFEDGTEFAGIELEEVGADWEGMVVAYHRSSYDFTSDGSYGVSHQANACYARLSLPEWMTSD